MASWGVMGLSWVGARGGPGKGRPPARRACFCTGATCIVNVITSYSIHYTKLYEADGAANPMTATGHDCDLQMIDHLLILSSRRNNFV